MNIVDSRKDERVLPIRGLSLDGHETAGMGHFVGVHTELHRGERGRRIGADNVAQYGTTSQWRRELCLNRQTSLSSAFVVGRYWLLRRGTFRFRRHGLLASVSSQPT